MFISLGDRTGGYAVPFSSFPAVSALFSFDSVDSFVSCFSLSFSITFFSLSSTISCFTVFSLSSPVFFAPTSPSSFLFSSMYLRFSRYQSGFSSAIRFPNSEFSENKSTDSSSLFSVLSVCAFGSASTKARILPPFSKGSASKPSTSSESGIS